MRRLVFRIKSILLLLLLSQTPVLAGEGDWNVRTSPIMNLIGIYNLEVDYAITPQWTLGPLLNDFDFEYSDTEVDSFMYGVRANYYLDSALDGGWVASLSATYGSIDISEPGTISGVEVDYTASTSVRVYTALFSYQAMWDSFNMMFGLGATYFSLPETVFGINGVNKIPISTSFISGVLPNAEFSLGWRF